MFHIFPALIGIYVAARFVSMLSIGTAWKWVTACIILLVSQYHLFKVHFFPGTLASPEVPSSVLVASGWLSGAFLLLCLFLFVRDLFLLLLWAANKLGALSVTAPWASGNRCALFFIAIPLLLSAVGVWQAIRVPDVKKAAITLPRLPAELDGLKLVQLTDLHASRLLQADWVRQVVDKTNSLQPDLIVITGDLVDGSTENRKLDVAPYRDLKARLGVFVITGNHEYYSNYLAWMDTFSKMGLAILKNEHVILRDKGQALVLAGVTDRIAARFGLPEPDIAQALTGAPKDVPIILLAHQPRGAAAYADAGVDLQLSGHTHGGQILGLHWIVQAANNGFVSGLYQVGKMQLYVSNGTGLWNGLPIRLGKPSEITELTLHAQPK